MSWIKRVFGRGRRSEVEPDVNCSFCGKHRREIRKLVAGPSVYICDECLGLCEQILDDEAYNDEQRSYFGGALLASVLVQGRQAAHARVRPALRAVIELERRHPAALRRVVAAAAAIDDLETAVAATRAIPVAERTTTDVLNLAGLLSDQGSHEEALVALATIDRTQLSGVDAILHGLHEAFAQVERGGLDKDTVAALRARATELGHACDALPAGSFEDDVRAERLAVMTVAALAARSIDAAENAARARVALRPESASAYEHLARVLTARGDDAGAQVARTTGLSLAHPDGPFARRLSGDTGGGPFR